MKFALVNGLKTEPQPKLHGICSHCQSVTISKCGERKVWHWAHKSKISCDPWWENETEWHREWKNKFPSEWQEISHVDPFTGERHIADIKTANGYIVEFQHSAIHPAEMRSREAFYKNMVWVVDGTRLKRDYPRFLKGMKDFKPAIISGFFLSYFPEEFLPTAWLNASAPILFDFRGLEADSSDVIANPLWCLFPNRIEGYTVLAGVSRQQFVELSSNNSELLLAKEFLELIQLHIQQQRANTAAKTRSDNFRTNYGRSQWKRRRF